MNFSPGLFEKEGSFGCTSEAPRPYETIVALSQRPPMRLLRPDYEIQMGLCRTSVTRLIGIELGAIKQLHGLDGLTYANTNQVLLTCVDHQVSMR